MQCRDCGGTARQDEAGERFERRVHRVDLALQPFNLARDDAQRAVDLSGSGNVGAEIEEVVLDSQQPVRELARTNRSNRNADRGIGFVDFADSRHAQARFAHSAAVDETRAAAVARPRVDFVELDQAQPLYLFAAPATTRISTTMTIATA